jgi:hypothetical protein
MLNLYFRATNLGPVEKWVKLVSGISNTWSLDKQLRNSVNTQSEPLVRRARRDEAM